MKAPSHKAGFVSIIGKPNVGKSTLMNQLVGERISIITSKAQTTRHRIMGIISGEGFQIIYSDTPGVMDPAYTLQQSMMSYVKRSLEDADIILLLTEPEEKADPELIRLLSKTDAPIIFLINKSDLGKGSQIEDKMGYWKEQIPAHTYMAISALKGDHIPELLELIKSLLPEHPPYFPKDDLTDKPERFFASEIIREKIFLNYQQEVPYSTEVVITDFIEEMDIIRVRAVIYVERDSQKGIIIGKKGAALKKVGTEARLDMETFFDKKVFLETFVKVAADWRKQEKVLRKFGYIER